MEQGSFVTFYIPMFDLLFVLSLCYFVRGSTFVFCLGGFCLGATIEGDDPRVSSEGFVIDKTQLTKPLIIRLSGST